VILSYLLLPGARTTPDRPHRLAGTVALDGSPVQRRVEVRDRQTGMYVISTMSRFDGSFDLSNLPAQMLRTPYYVICFDDRNAEYGNALIYDRVYQVDDDGNPPQT